MSSLWTVFFSQEPVGLAVTGIILLLFAIGLLEVLASWSKLARDREALRAVRDNLPKLAGDTPSGPDAVLRLLGCEAGSLLGDRIARVLQLRAAGLGHRELLQKLTLERVEGYGSHARFIATVLTMLGLVGTVAGMSLAMLRMTGAFQNVNNTQKLPELIAALGGTLEGMKTAFACTLAGLAAAIVLSFFNHLLRRRQSGFVRQMEELVICEFLPQLEHVDPESEQSTKAFANVLDQSAGRIDKLSTSLKEAADRYESGSQQMERMVDAFNSAMTSFAASVSRLSGNQEAFTTTMAETNKAAASLTSLVDHHLTQIKEFQAQAQKALLERLSGLDAGQKSNEALQRSILEYHAKFQEFVQEAMGQLTETSRKMLSEISQNYKDGVVGHVDRSHQEFSHLIQEHSAHLESFKNMMLEVHINGRAGQAAGGRS